ncbi:MAG: TolC family protein [Candidatus Muiribacteriota bacterium]
MIKKKVYFFILIFLFFLFTRADNPRLTLDNAIEEALKNNTRIIQSRQSLEMSKLSLESTKAGSEPSADISQTASISQRKGTNFSDSYSTSLSLRYNILDGGKHDLKVERAHKNYQKQLNNHNKLKLDIKNSVKEAYYKIIQKKEALKVSESIYERRKRDLALIRLKYEAGRENLQAVHESETNLADAEFKLHSSKTEIEDAFFELNILLNRDLYDIYEIDEDEIYNEMEFNDDYKKLLNIALKNRADILNAEIDLKLAELNYKQEEIKDSGELDAAWTNQLSGSEPFRNHSYNIGLTYSISRSLYDGGQDDNKFNELKININQRKDSLESLTVDLKNNLKRAMTSYDLSKRQLQLSKQKLKSSHDIYTLTQLQYEQGDTTYFFLQQKESELTSAEYSHVNALFNLKLQGLRLIQTLGRSTL